MRVSTLRLESDDERLFLGMLTRMYSSRLLVSYCSHTCRRATTDSRFGCCVMR